jgi:predicted ATPase
MALAVGARMLAKIDDRFALLTTGDPTAAPYHRSLDALVRWRAMTCALPRNGYSGRE